MTFQANAEQAEAITRLRELMPKGATVYTVLRHVSSSGMSRSMDVITIADNEPLQWSRLVACAMGWKMSRKHGGVIVQGCGMDMGFHLIYELSALIHGDGYALQQRWL